MNKTLKEHVFKSGHFHDLCALKFFVMNKGLYALAMGGLAIGMTEFAIMGVLPNIAEDLAIEIPEAAHLIAIYALGVVVGAPTLVFFTGKYRPKHILLFLMMIFVVFNTLFALMPGLFLMQISRFASGLPHGAFFGVGSVVATRLARPGREARAISVMFAGLTFANLIGVPIGTYLGQNFSWRLTYGVVSLMGILTIVSLLLWMPDLAQKTGNNLKKQLGYFKKWRSWLLVAVISIGTGGLFAWVSYIAPLVTKVSGLNSNRVPIIMLLVGSGMVVGNIIGGKLADSVNPTKATIISFIAMAICLVVVHFTASFYYAAYFMAFTTGTIAFTSGTPIQMMLIRDAKGAETFAAAAGQACFNIGNTFGAYLGGIPITLGFAYNTPVLVGVGMASIGALLAYAFLQSKPLKNSLHRA